MHPKHLCLHRVSTPVCSGLTCRLLNYCLNNWSLTFPAGGFSLSLSISQSRVLWGMLVLHIKPVDSTGSFGGALVEGRWRGPDAARLPSWIHPRLFYCLRQVVIICIYYHLFCYESTLCAWYLLHLCPPWEKDASSVATSTLSSLKVFFLLLLKSTAYWQKVLSAVQTVKALVANCDSV